MYVTVHNIDTLKPKELMTEFLVAIKELIEMDASDYADRCNVHPEWVARECWNRMDEKDKADVKKYVPTIEKCMTWENMSEEFQTVFYEFYMGYFY